MGKTTVANLLMEKRPSFEYIHFPTEDPPPDATPFWFIRDYTPVFFSLDPDKDYIIDRLWPTTLVYVEENWSALRRTANYMGSVFQGVNGIYLYADPTTLRQRQMRGNKDRMERDVKVHKGQDKLLALKYAYDTLLLKRAGWVTIDAEQQPENIVRSILHEIDKY